MNTPPLRVLHFADAHIDIANHGRHDPQTGLPVRIMDFLKALDQIINRAIEDRVDLVIFAGDAYKDRNPNPTFQREWGQRMMQLSQAGIPTVLLVGNHDVSPTLARAHALQEFTTFKIPHIHVADQLRLFTPAELGAPVQLLAIPWLSRSALMSRTDTASKSHADITLMLEERLAQAVANLLDKADNSIPLILTAHASVQGAKYGSERMVMLGQEFTLTGSMLRDRRIDYVALGHIHKHQELSNGSHPPIVYPGSIERIDFGEVREKKGYVMAEISRGHTSWAFVPLRTRPFYDIKIETPNAETFMADIMRQLPPAEKVADAMCRIQLSYPADWETLLDEGMLHNYFQSALSLQIQKLRHTEQRSRLGDIVAVEKLTPEELLTTYWRTKGIDEDEIEQLQAVAQGIFSEEDV